MDNGYEEMLRTLGGDFTSFVQNLDALHAHLSRTYTKLNYPSFRSVKTVIYVYYLFISPYTQKEMWCDYQRDYIQ